MRQQRERHRLRGLAVEVALVEGDDVERRDGRTKHGQQHRILRAATRNERLVNRLGDEAAIGIRDGGGRKRGGRGNDVRVADVVPFDERYFDGEAKEAVAFALLAHLHFERIAGNVPTATGARGPRVLGMLTPA